MVRVRPLTILVVVDTLREALDRPLLNEPNPLPLKDELSNALKNGSLTTRVPLPPPMTGSSEYQFNI